MSSPAMLSSDRDKLRKEMIAAIEAGNVSRARSLMVEYASADAAEQPGADLSKRPSSGHNVGRVRLSITSSRTEDIPEDEAAIILEIIEEAVVRFKNFVEGEVPHLTVRRDTSW